MLTGASFTLFIQNSIFSSLAYSDHFVLYQCIEQKAMLYKRRRICLSPVSLEQMSTGKNLFYVIFQVLTATRMKMAVFWVVAPGMVALMMEAASASEMSVNLD
jgi:hypothetical protein